MSASTDPNPPPPAANPRKDAFMSLVEFQDCGMTVPESRREICQLYDLCLSELVEIEAEGRRLGWLNQTVRKPGDIEPAMQKVLSLFASSGLTQQALGEKMGYQSKSVRQSVSQFLKTNDPRVSMLRRFAKAMNVPLCNLVEEAQP